MSSKREIPSLDGIRALSVFLVVLAHVRWALPGAFTAGKRNELLGVGGTLGVAMFFLISGYLICTLLLRELERTGSVNLLKFYFRRTLRILPAFYFYLLVVGVVCALGLYRLEPSAMAKAASYLWTYFPDAQGFLVAHCWSLSIEEQFYLAWPLILLLAYRRNRSVATAAVIVALMPVLRLAWYFLRPAERGLDSYGLIEWIDTIMIGCLLAMALRSPTWTERLTRVCSGWAALLAAAVALVILPVMGVCGPSPAVRAALSLFEGDLRAACFAVVLCYSVLRPSTGWGAFLNVGWMRHLGFISYSTYLWQQLFTYQPFGFGLLGVALTYAAAEGSYYGIEQPFLRLRDAWELRLWPPLAAGALD